MKKFFSVPQYAGSIFLLQIILCITPIQLEATGHPETDVKPVAASETWFLENKGQVEVPFGVRMDYYAPVAGGWFFLTPQGPVVDLFAAENKESLSKAFEDQLFQGLNIQDPKRSGSDWNAILGRSALRPEESGHDHSKHLRKGHGANILPQELQTPGRMLPEKAHALCYKFVNPLNLGSQPVAYEPAPHTTNFFIGQDQKNWKTDLRSYARVEYPEVWKGIDVIYKQGDQGLKYEYRVKPGGNPFQILTQVLGLDSWNLNPDGSLSIKAGNRMWKEAPPVAWQIIKGEQVPVHVEFSLLKSAVFTFKLGSYDPKYELIIDPYVYSSYLGGSNFDHPWDIVVDDQGYAYVVGETKSVDFPTKPGAYQINKKGADNHSGEPNGLDVFISKIAPDGKSLVWSTYLGGTMILVVDGNEPDFGRGIALGPDGSVYVTGWTHCTDFPVFPGPTSVYQGTHGGGSLAGESGHDFYDVFVTRLNPQGNGLIFSTYLGANGDDFGLGIRVDGQGNAWVTGMTVVYNDQPNQFPGAKTGNNTQKKGDAFVTGVKSDGSGLIWSTVFGANEAEGGMDLELGADGRVYVTGFNYSQNFPATFLKGGGVQAGFVAYLDNQGTIKASSVLGFNSTGFGVRIASSGDVVLCGRRGSEWDPIVPWNPDFYKLGDQNVISIMRFSAGIDSLKLSIPFGGSPYQFADALVLDAQDNIYITGQANHGLPVTLNADRPTLDWYSEAYIMKLNINGDILYSSYLGGGGVDWGRGIALGPDGSVYVAGNTISGWRPVSSGAFQPYYKGLMDGFVLRYQIPGDSEVGVPQALHFVRKDSSVTGWDHWIDHNRTWFEDGFYYKFSESVAGHGTNGIYNFNCKDAPADVQKIRVQFNGFTVPVGSEIGIDIRDQVTGTWKPVGSLSAMYSYTRKYFELEPAGQYVKADGLLQLRLSGALVKEQYIDAIRIYTATSSRDLMPRDGEVITYCVDSFRVDSGQEQTALSDPEFCLVDGRQLRTSPSPRANTQITYHYTIPLAAQEVNRLDILVYSKFWKEESGLLGGWADAWTLQQYWAYNFVNGVWEKVWQIGVNYNFNYHEIWITNASKYVGPGGVVKIRTLAQGYPHFHAVEIMLLRAVERPQPGGGPIFPFGAPLVGGTENPALMPAWIQPEAEHVMESFLNVPGISGQDMVQVFPVPATKFLGLRFTQDVGSFRIIVQDLQGRILRNQNVYAHNKYAQIQGLEELVPGMYAYRIWAGSQTCTGTFLKE